MTPGADQTTFFNTFFTIWGGGLVFFAISVCLVFKKAGQPWWGALVPEAPVLT